MPNAFAYAALIAWPLVALILFRTLPKPQAAVWALLASYLFLPERVALDLPGMPPLDKISIPALAALCLAAATAGPKFRPIPRSAVARVLLFALFAGELATMLTNRDPIQRGPVLLPGLAPYDVVASVVQTGFVVAPFLIGRSLLGDLDGHRAILKAMAAAGLVYACLMLVEIRLSPQLHNWVYGFFPHSFFQQIRGDGYRPVVFLQHGLWTAFFAMAATAATAVLWRAAPPQRRGPLLLATLFLFGVLALSRSLGALVFALLLVPATMLLGLRTQIGLAAALAAVVTLYPMLRGAELVPIRAALEAAAAIDPDRAGSLAFRFENEDLLLERARERPVFGWGRWGRNHVYDTESGRMLTIADGYWVIVIGNAGWVGHLAVFGLLAWPIVAIWRAQRGPPPAETAGLCLLLAINLVELLPNASLMPWTWLVAGALLGRAERVAAAAPEAGMSVAAGSRRERIETVL